MVWDIAAKVSGETSMGPGLNNLGEDIGAKRRREGPLAKSQERTAADFPPLRGGRAVRGSPMKLHHFTREQLLPISLGEAWDFFSSPRNLGELTPGDFGFRIVHCPAEKMHEGQIIEYRVKVAPALWLPWVTEIKAVEEGRGFIDEQRFGPYKFWHHRHRLEAVPGGVKVGDLIHYGLPFGIFGGIAHALFVRRQLETIFEFRRSQLERRFGKMP
jgi:ligand-binding SRPBCC domain-containing protein